MNETSTIFYALKKQLKARKVSYAMLATRTGMSEANVKRIFSTETCTLARLTEICGAIDLSLAALMRAAAETEPEIFTLPKAAEDFFADHLDYFVFYRQLEHGHGVEELQEKNGLSAKELSRYLKKIEELGLIERLPGDRIKLLHQGYLHLKPNSRLQSKYFRRWVPYFFERVMQPEEKHFVKIFSTGLTEKNRRELLRDLEDVAKKYQERGYFDQKTGSNPFEAVGVCIGVGPYRVGEGKVVDYRN